MYLGTYLTSNGLPKIVLLLLLLNSHIPTWFAISPAQPLSLRSMQITLRKKIIVALLLLIILYARRIFLFCFDRKVKITNYTHAFQKRIL